MERKGEDLGERFCLLSSEHGDVSPERIHKFLWKLENTIFAVKVEAG
jgi:hypothetical protein